MSTESTSSVEKADVTSESSEQPFPPLWPKGMKIPFIGVTGEYQAGKTLFGLLIDPTRTIVFDTEKSSETYEGSLGFTRIDLSDAMRAKFPAGDYRPVQLFEAWLQMVQKVKPGQYRVMLLDTLSEIETGLVDYVRRNPNRFGYTSAQFAKSEALMWGAAKDFWKQILTDITGRVETFVTIAHMRDKWAGNRPTGQREAKGKETIMEMASLYLELNRDPVNGKTPEKPAAKVLKSRLSVFLLDKESGEMEPHPVLPPRLPVCTPAAIRNYIENPPDYSKLKKAEKVQERTLSEDERLLIQREIADRNAESARLELEKAERSGQTVATNANEGVRQEATVVETTDSTEVSESVSADSGHDARTAGTSLESAEPANSTGHNGVEISTETVAEEMVNDGQLAEMLKLVRESGMPQDVWKQALSKFHVESAKKLSRENGDKILHWLRATIDKKKKSAELEQWADQQTSDAGDEEGDGSDDPVPFQQ